MAENDFRSVNHQIECFLTAFVKSRKKSEGYVRDNCRYFKLYLKLS